MTDTTKMIAELEELMAKATLGPWKADHYGRFIQAAYGDWLTICETEWCGHNKEKQKTNAALIVAMRNALPELIEEIRACWKMLERSLSTQNTLLDQRGEADARAEKADTALAEAVLKLGAAVIRAEKAEEELASTRLVWTTELPQSPGFYFQRNAKGTIRGIFLCQADISEYHEPALRFDAYDKAIWTESAGPLQLPVEAAKRGAGEVEHD